MATLCVFGDSIAWGAWDREQGGWVGRLRSFIEKQGIEIDVYNLSISGNSTKELLKRLGPEARARNATMIIIAIGINDAQYGEIGGEKVVSLEDFTKNLDKLMKTAASITPDIFFVGLTPVDETKTKPASWNPQSWYDNKSIGDYDTVLQKWCEDKRVLYIPVRNVIQKGDLDDGVHLTSQGHEKIFEAVKSHVLTLIT